MSQTTQLLQLHDLQFSDVNFTGVKLVGDLAKGNYYVTLADSISRILTTRLGERVMRPEFGSDLYLLRDRDFNSEWRVLATRYIFEAIQRWEPRVKFGRLNFNINAITGQHYFYLELQPNDQLN